jgi:outer membrane receptor protein involved in Fe transport
MPAFLRFQKSRRLAGRIANRKQVTMQNPQQLRGRASLPALLFVTLTFNLAPAQVLGPAEPAATVPATAKSASPSRQRPAVKIHPTAMPGPYSQPVPPGDTPTADKLPTIVVTAATRTPQSVETTASTTTVITHQELDDAKYASVPDALQSVPGMSVVTSGMPGAQTSVFIHGLDSNQTLVTDRRPPPGGRSFRRG